MAHSRVRLQSFATSSSKLVDSSNRFHCTAPVAMLVIYFFVSDVPVQYISRAQARGPSTGSCTAASRVVACSPSPSRS